MLRDSASGSAPSSPSTFSCLTGSVSGTHPVLRQRLGPCSWDPAAVHPGAVACEEPLISPLLTPRCPELPPLTPTPVTTTPPLLPRHPPDRRPGFRDHVGDLEAPAVVLSRLCSCSHVSGSSQSHQRAGVALGSVRLPMELGGRNSSGLHSSPRTPGNVHLPGGAPWGQLKEQMRRAETEAWAAQMDPVCHPGLNPWGFVGGWGGVGGLRL
ncbi:uncharacterized protein LOC118920547 [Manis pentadactyla]|uniref:uncharacterized protein LOC118920547 n=1 Tax=Manis pentadactyla TaxID=143292 RepID=UPI00255C451C|nr:uncharacterized protein LOC118920547 [Manis pentadactyla]